MLAIRISITWLSLASAMHVTLQMLPLRTIRSRAN
nr:MAG TPA: hypothetical protein [Caudoviricetes sp.]